VPNIIAEIFGTLIALLLVDRTIRKYNESQNSKTKNIIAHQVRRYALKHFMCFEYFACKLLKIERDPIYQFSSYSAEKFFCKIQNGIEQKLLSLLNKAGSANEQALWQLYGDNSNEFKLELYRIIDSYATFIDANMITMMEALAQKLSLIEKFAPEYSLPNKQDNIYRFTKDDYDNYIQLFLKLVQSAENMVQKN